MALNTITCFCYGWYITIYRWKIDNGKTEVLYFVIDSGRKLTVGVKFKVNVNNISAISWLPVLFVKETGVPGENHRLAVSH